MAANVLLLEVQPRNVATGARVMVRLAGGGADIPYRFGNQDWRAGLINMPQIIAGLVYSGSDMGNGAVPQALSLEWKPGSSARLEEIAGYHYDGAPFSLYYGPESVGAGMPSLLLSGKVVKGKIADGVLALTMSDPAAELARAVVEDTFAGTGGLEGPAEWQGRVKRRMWGRVWNVEGWGIDPPNNIYSFGDPSKPINAYSDIRDKGVAYTVASTLAWQGSIAATFAALQAASVAAGAVVMCPSINMVKTWARPAGILAADIQGELFDGGFYSTAADIAVQIVGARNGPAFVAGTGAAASTARPDACGILADDLQMQIGQALDYMLGGVSLYWVLEGGEIRIGEWAFGASAGTFTSDSVDRLEWLPPLQYRKLGYRRNNRPMAAGDLAAILTYGDGTPIDDLQPAAPGADVTYDNISAGIIGQGPGATATGPQVLNNRLENGVLRIPKPVGGTINTVGTAVAGSIRIQLPAAGTNSMVRFLVDIFEYASGKMQTYEIGGYTYVSGPNWINCSARMIGGSGASRPVYFARTGGSNFEVWIGNISGTWEYPAAAIRDVQISFGGQTESLWDDGWIMSHNTGGPSAIDFTVINPNAGDAVFGVNALETWGGSLATLNNFKTALGTAAAIVSQGALATLSSLANGGPYLSGFGALSGLSSLLLGGGQLFAADGTTPLTNANTITANGTAAAISGQAAWATYTGLVPSNVAGQVQFLQTDGYLPASGVYKAGADLLTNRWPAELGANVTESRTAASIAGQGTLATLNSLAYGSAELTGFGSIAALTQITLGSSYLKRSDGTTIVTETLVITSIGVASAISGQGALATLNEVATGQIGLNAATDASNNTDFTGTTATGAYNTYVVLASQSVTVTDANTNVLILMGAILKAIATSGAGTMTGMQAKVRIMRGATIIRAAFEFANVTGSVTPPTSFQQTESVSVIDADAPGVGTWTYTVEVTVTITGGTGTKAGSVAAIDGTLFTILFKR